MLIGVKKRFVFVANSKAGSTSIEQALLQHAEIERAGTPQRKHIFLRDAIREYWFLFGQEGTPQNSFFRFGVMRDPVDWISSWFRYRKANKVDAPLPEAMDFAGFWARQDWNFHNPDGSPRLQRDFFTNRAGRVIVDYLIPFEALDAHFRLICEGLGIGAELKRVNVSRMAPEALELPEGLVGELRDFYAGDYALISEMERINARGLRKLEAMAAARREKQRAGPAAGPGAG